MRYRTSMVLGLVMGLGAVGIGQAQTIYRCVGAAGEAYFTDRACGRPVAAPDPADVMALPSLDAQQWRAVKQLDRRLAARARAAAAQRSREARASGRAAAVRARACSAAHAGLERVRQIKRRGYAAARAGDLRARQRKYQLQIQQRCP